MKVVKKIKSKKKKITGLFIGIIAICVFSFFCIFLFNTYNNIEINQSNYVAQKTQSTKQEETVENIEEKSEEIADVIEETTKSVVGISKLKTTGSSILSKSSEDDLGLGTGIIVTENGYILSNEHVTGAKYSICYITLEDGQNYEGTVAWSDSDLDLSITKIKAEKLKHIKLGDSDKIRVGQTVYAIGNPIGFEFRRTVTSGIISAKNRTIKLEEVDKTSYMSNLIQTDATINPGNSGGPLIYSNGEMIGINTVKITSAEGIGFAVPIKVIENVIKNFKEKGSFEEATLGIYAYDGTAVQYLNSTNLNSLTNSANFTKGIYVEQVIKNSPASETDLKEGDIITSIDNIELKTMNDLREYIFTKKPEDNVTLKINRGKINKEVVIKLGKK